MLTLTGQKTILFDQDGVIADWQGMFDELLESQFPHIKVLPREEITIFKAQKLYAPEYHADIAKMMDTPGFYRELKPIDGAVEALHQIRAAGYETFICTAPYVTNETCASEKMAWVREHLGEEWLNRMVITSDKTLVRGDVLIDDKPDIKGAMAPVWKHVVFDAPYNRHVLQRLDRWSDWKDVLDKVLA
jgi:5'-nucleotidase